MYTCIEINGYIYIEENKLKLFEIAVVAISTLLYLWCVNFKLKNYGERHCGLYCTVSKSFDEAKLLLLCYTAVMTVHTFAVHFTQW